MKYDSDGFDRMVKRHSHHCDGHDNLVRPTWKVEFEVERAVSPFSQKIFFLLRIVCWGVLSSHSYWGKEVRRVSDEC